MQSQKERSNTIIAVGIALPALTILAAAITETAMPDGYVRYVALLQAIGGSLIGGAILAWHLATQVVGFKDRDEEMQGIVMVNDHIVVRSNAAIGPFRELDKAGKKIVVIPATRKRARPFEDIPLSPEFYQTVVNGGNSHAEYQH